MFSYGTYGESGMIGWVEFNEDDEGTEEIPRNVVAYMPLNFDVSTLKAVRERFKAGNV
jgi:hypothetical protein